MTENLAAIFHVDDALLSPHAAVYGADPATRLVALAQALASSEPWTRLRGRGARLSVRPSSGLIGILGNVEDGERSLLGGVEHQVRDAVGRLLPVPWSEVEAACGELAAQLRAELSVHELERCRIVGVPRGGLIVAGLLAYAMELDRPRVGRESGDGPLIVVDDCAISGTRMVRWLRRSRESGVIIATLHALPELAASIERREQRVRRWLIARPLVDHAVRRPDHAAWRREWAERFPSDPWIGEPDHVVFPWNEPDMRLWNDASGRGEVAWHVVPPAWCLKNRVTQRPDDVSVCPEGRAPLRPPDDAIWASLDVDTTVLARVGDASVRLLRGIGSRLWDAIVATGDQDASVDQLPPAAHDDLHRLVGELVERGYLVRAA